MRILHTSDWHLGRTFHGRLLDDAHAAFADHLVDVVREESVDAVVIPGDVYDRAIAPVDSVRLLNDTLSRLTALTRVVLTPGNHDSASRLGFASQLFRSSLVIRSSVTQAATPVIIPTADGADGLYIYPLPYLDPDAASWVLPDVLAAHTGEEFVHEEGTDARLPRSHEAVVSAALRLVAHDLASRRATQARRVPSLVMAHAFVAGGTASVDSERDIRVGGVDSVPSEIFETLGSSPCARESGGLDYVALGHLHRPQEIKLPRRDTPALDREEKRPRLIYSGSPLPFSFDEAAWGKSSVIADFDATGLRSIERIPAPSPHRIETIRGTMEELLGPDFEGLTDAWIKAVVCGPLPRGGLAPLRDRFPHLLALTREETGELPTARVAVTRSVDPLSVCREFFESVSGRPLTQEDQQALTLAYDAARDGAE